LGHKPPVTNTYQARRASSLIVTADYRHSVIPKEFELSEKDIPPALARKPGESLAQWRDRLWLEYRTPVVTAALEDIKAAYVEILNPLLCSKIVRVIQALPDELRTHKALFEKIVREMFPGVPFAKRDSIQHIEEILSVASVKKFIRCHLLDSRHLQVLPEKFLTFLAESLDKRLTGAPVTRRLKVLSRAYLPNSMWNLLRRQVGHEALNIHRTSLRALIIICMTRLLEEDAQAGRKALQGVVEV
jgi:hypothetical protein